jgi:hypothetical protein
MKNNIMTVLFYLLAGISFNLFAQTDSTSAGSVKTKMLTISPGFAVVNVSALNQFLALSGPKDGFSQNFGLLGIETTTECKRFIYGYTLQAGMSQKKTISDYAGVPGQNIDYYATYGNLLLHSGYSIISTERVKFYPMIGAGFGRVSANYNRIDNQHITNYATNPNLQGSVGKYMACFDAALSLDLLMSSNRFNSYHKESNASYGRVLGIRVGYTQGVGVGNWMFKSGRILENPTYNPGMFYAKVQFGIYSKRARNCSAGCHR